MHSAVILECLVAAHRINWADFQDLFPVRKRHFLRMMQRLSVCLRSLAMPAPKNPAEIAREVFRRLATRRVLPTPEAYRDVYHEVAGTEPQAEIDRLMERFLHELVDVRPETAALRQTISEALAARDWRQCEVQLAQLARVLHSVSRQAPSQTISLSRPASPVSASPAGRADPEATARQLLVRLLGSTFVSLLQGTPDLAEDAAGIAASLRDAPEGTIPFNTASRIKQLDYRIELRNGDANYQQVLMLDMVRLLLDNVMELVDDDRWLAGQILEIQEILRGDLDAITLKEALQRLKEVVFKQGVIKHSLGEAKNAFKNMMLTFIDRAGALAETTGEYHGKMDSLAQQISQTESINILNTLLAEVMQETRTMQSEAARSRDAVRNTRDEAQAAEARIQDLERQLIEMSELAHEDPLTGSMNRRGMDDLLDREMARADRSGDPLCVALLDLDDFKRLNDTHGHSAGDQALIHLVRVVKDTLRAMDVIARFGGEEFLIALPDTPLEAAMATITRVQRELTKQLFLCNEERLLITFSAGVALYASHESKSTLIKRIDQALYQAKAAGKNRVIAAP